MGARGSGKTAGSVLKAFSYCQQHPGARGVLTAPTDFMIRNTVLATAKDFFGDGLGKWWDWREKAGQVTFQNGSLIHLRPAEEPERFRGLDLAFFGIGEAGIGNQYEAWRVLLPCLRQKGYPHQGWIDTTPKPEARWIKQIWLDKTQPERGTALTSPHEFPLHHALMDDNPHLTEEDKQHLRDMFEGTRWAQQELMGEFISLEGLAYPDLDANIHYKRSPADVEFVRTVTGFDPGGVRPTALVTVSEDRSGRLWAHQEFYKPNAAAEDWVEWVAERNIKELKVDPSFSDDDIARHFRRYGVRIRRARVKRFHDRVQLLATRLRIKDGQPGIFVTPDCPNLWDELQNLAYARPRGQDYQVDKWVPGTMDHCLTGDTIVETSLGPKRIDECSGGWVLGYDGKYHRYTAAKKTGTQSEVVAVQFRDGRIVRCTPDHRFLTADGWTGAVSLTGKAVVDIGRWLGYNVQHGAEGDLADYAGVDGQTVLPVRPVFSAAGTSAASGGVATLQRPDTGWDARSSRESRPSGQPYREFDLDGKGGAPFASRTDLFEKAERCSAPQSKDRHEVALYPRRQGMALEARTSTKTIYRERALPGLPEGVQGYTQEQGQVLQPCLFAEVTSVEAAGCEDVYNISVDDVYSFPVHRGLIVHNSFDALCYAMADFDMRPLGRPQPEIYVRRVA